MSFGCVFALNRVHTPAGPADAGRVAEAEAEAEAEGGGERVADVLLLPVARRAGGACRGGEACGERGPAG